MADKITNCGTLKRKTGSSFQALESGYVGQALSNLDNDIASKNTGVFEITTEGPVFHACLGKLNDSLYSGFLFGYPLPDCFYYFVRLNGTYSLTKIVFGLGGGVLKALISQYFASPERWCAA